MTEVEVALDYVIDSLRAIVARQQGARHPPHDDFAVWGSALSSLTMRLGDIGRVLTHQVSVYGHKRVLRDDQDKDPYIRLTDAAADLREMTAALTRAHEAARRYHAAVAHVGVEVDPDAKPS